MFWKRRFVLIPDIANLSDRLQISDISYHQHEWVRISAMELAAREIYQKDIPGSVAELGVWRGDFARIINQAFLDRTLYLFDTFQGFDKRDLQQDDYQMGQDFSETSPEMVLSRMPHPERCILKPGYFPESLDGLEDQFCFVSLDPDLLQPALAGLRYFYTRLVKGGYIFLHDYNNDPYPGIREAAKIFMQEQEIKAFPLPDWGGTLVIAK